MSEIKETAAENKDADGPAKKTQRELNRESWDAYWKVLDIETKGNPFKRIRFLAWRAVDWPVTWVKENFLEPLQEKNKWPYYHRRFNRVRSIDQCNVGDYVCLHEANWQYRLDKTVDAQILCILRQRMDECLNKYGTDNIYKCAKCHDKYEEAELNYYIKYGELGMYADSTDAYMKQKHRMIWERRHPKIMQIREEAYKKYKEDLDKGIFDMWFWKRGYYWQFRNYTPSIYKNQNQDPNYVLYRDNISQDPYYYKEREETGRKEPYEGHSPFESFP